MILENDDDIIKEYVQNGNQRAATAFVRKYQKFVYATALRHLKHHEDADDAAQEVFIKALKYLPNFKGDSSVKTWLYRITTNVCINVQRKKKISSFFSFLDVSQAYDLQSDTKSAQQDLEDNEFQRTYYTLLDKLPPKQREVFHLRYYDELSYEEISKMLGTSVGGLKANYHQAVKKIAQELKPKLKKEGSNYE